MVQMLCGILYMEYDSPEAAERSAERYKDCPKVLFWATKGSNAYILLTLNEEGRFWAEYIRDHPERTFGGRRAELVFAERVHYPELSMRIPEEPGDVSPCDSNCSNCPSHGKLCEGCPATIHYEG